MIGTHPACEAVLDLLGQRTGLSFSSQRQEHAAEGIRRAMARAGVTNPDSYRNLLARDPKLLDDLIVELTVGETYFFRESAQYEFIRNVILPDIVRRRGPEHRIRIWSAACASGEEAYSLAILLTKEGLIGQSHLLATDISRAALAKARQAVYPNWSLRGEGAVLAIPYLRRKGNLYTLDDALRSSVTFEYLNLALDVYPSFATGTQDIDLILCRNVLIYFNSATVQAVAHRFFGSLAPGGWLITASTDPPLGKDVPYETVVTEAGVFYRKPLDRRLITTSYSDEKTNTVEVEPFVGEPESCPNTLESSLPCSTTPTTSESSPPIDHAREAFASGNYIRAAGLTQRFTDIDTCILHVRALANIETSQAEHACAEAAARYSLCAEIHYLHAMLLLELERHKEASQAVRRVIYLDRSLAVGHLALGSMLWRQGDRTGARRAYRNAHDLCAAQPPNEIVPLSDGEHAGRLADVAAARLAILDAAPEVMP